MRGRLGLAQHLLDDARAVDGRVAVHGADDELELRLEPLGLLRAGAHQREKAHALAVQAEVLGEGLREEQRVAVGDECAQGSGVGLGVTRGEALVGLGIGVGLGLGVKMGVRVGFAVPTLSLILTLTPTW